MKRIKILGFLLVSISLLSLIPNTYGEKKPLRKVTWATPTTPGSMSAIPFETALRKGFYREEGLDFEIILMKSTLTAIAVKVGEVDYGGSADITIRAAAAGMPIKLIFVITRALPHALMAKSQIKKGQDLKGKVIAVSGIGSGGHFGAMKIMEHFGLDPKKDVTFVGVGSGPMTYTALVSGSVDAAMVTSPLNSMAQKRGFTRIIDLADIFETPSVGLAVRNETLQKDRELARKTIRATLKGLEYVKTHRDEIAESLVKTLGMDRELAYEHHSDMIKSYTKYGRSSDQGIKNAVEIAVKEGAIKDANIPLSQVVDFSLVEEVRKELGIK